MCNMIVILFNHHSYNAHFHLAEDICRICLGEAEDSEALISPCDCSGSVKWVHQRCLLRWMKSRDDENCELCGYSYDVTSSIKPFRKVTFALKLSWGVSLKLRCLWVRVTYRVAIWGKFSCWWCRGISKSQTIFWLAHTISPMSKLLICLPEYYNPVFSSSNLAQMLPQWPMTILTAFAVFHVKWDGQAVVAE